MSAESPRRSRPGGPLTVPPQPPCDRSIMDTVSGFINDVTLTSAPTLDPKDIIQWARFETADPNGPSEAEDGDVQPLLLVLGYGSGVQVWLIRPGGEAQEALSWRSGSVRALRVLPTPSYGDYYAQKRPMMALCDSTGPGTAYCSLSFISLSCGDQVKSIKFKNPILDVVANKRSIVVSFAERLAVFDACKLEDRLTVTTCYPCPCPLGGITPANPLALGDRWLAYAERRLSPTKRSSGGCEGEGVASYTATVLHAAKSLGKGLRGLGESVASSLGGRPGALSQSPSPPHSEQLQPGVVTIIDLENYKITDEEGTQSDSDISPYISDSVVAHFIAHSEPIVALKFDASGMLLVTADKRGHDFHVFRIHPHPSGPNLASVHHLYILHRGDTTSKVQDMNISFDSRWVAVSTLRGTTHVFPITPYGGAVGVRTHASPHVVNRLSRFHRSAGLGADNRSNSPVGENLVNAAWYPNPRLPPFPAPCTIHPLAQIRPAPATGAAPALPTHTITRNSSGRQRLSSLSEEGQLPLAVCARWGAVSRIAAGVGRSRSMPSPPASQALYVMSAYGNLVQYHIHPKHVSGIPKEKVCDDTSIELEVEAKTQWPLVRPPSSQDIMAPLPSHHILIKPFNSSKASGDKNFLDTDDRWLSQVEIMTHAGPHRRLWMGPQFVFKTYNAASGTSLSLLDSDAVEVGTGPSVARSNPMNMPGARPMVPVLIESGSASSLEHSPRLSDAYRKGRDGIVGLKDGDGDGHREGEVRLKEDLAEAMRETDQGCEWAADQSWTKDQEDFRAPHRIVNPLGAVVGGASSSSSPSPPSEADSYIMSNEDEALFRPVVRAPRSLPAPTAPPTRPLSSRTLLPARHVSLPADNSNTAAVVPAASLADHVVIPAKLSQQQLNLASFVPTSKTHVEGEKKIEKKESEKESKPKKKQSGKKGKEDRSLNIQKQVEIDLKHDLKTFDKEITKIEAIASIPVVEVSKAFDEIQFCNNELVGNLKNEQKIHIAPHQCDNTAEKSDLKCNVNVTDICIIEDGDNDLKSNFECLDDELVTKTITMDDEIECFSDDKVVHIDDYIERNLNEEIENIKVDTLSKSEWPSLLGNKEAKPHKDFKPKVEVEGDGLMDDTRAKGRKNKKSKPKSKPLSIFRSPTRSLIVENELINETVKDDQVLPVTSSSWGGRETNKAENILQFPSDENVFCTEESKFYNQSNIVVALCDTPHVTELSFVDDHHSYFQEPPPLEPLDFDFENDDFTRKTSFAYEKIDIQQKGDRKIIKSISSEIEELKKSLGSSNSDSYQENSIVDDSNNRDKKERTPFMEKSSDEENVSSQAESDDCKVSSTPPTSCQSQISSSNSAGGHRSFDCEQEDLSSSSFSSASRASLDPPSSPTPSCSGDNPLHFPGDSSGSI